MQNSQHQRSLATGLFFASIAPVFIGILPMLIFSGTDKYLLEMVIPVSLIGLLISIPSALFCAVPLFLFLRRYSILCGLLLCLGCAIIGASVVAAIAFFLFRGVSTHLMATDHGATYTILTLGFAFGAVAGLALTFGSGVPFWRSMQNDKART